jgi:hypothetical protein
VASDQKGKSNRVLGLPGLLDGRPRRGALRGEY